MKKNIYLELLYLFFLGVFSSLSLPPFNYFIINFLTFSLLFIFLFKKNSYQKFNFFLYGWAFGFGYFISNIYWISISLTFDENFKALIPLSLILIPSFLAIFYGILTYLFAILRLKKIVSSFFLFSLLFGIVEFLRGSILTGFPWNLIAFSFSNHPELLSIMSIIGTFGFNLFCISLFISPSIFILRDGRKDLIVCVLFLILPILFYMYGTIYEKKFLKIEETNNNFTIRTIGSNINLDRFYRDVDPTLIINELIKISEPDPSKNIFFLWPEGIIPDIYQNEFVQYQYLFKDHFNSNHLLGLGINKQSYDQSGAKFFNSFSIYDNNLNLLNSYDKINLVPFGEFLPFEKILRKIGLKNLTNNYQSYSKGQKREAIQVNWELFSFKILPLICYEIIYSGRLYSDQNFDYIINVSEDGWFGSSIGPKQHFVHSIFRAIESGKYVIRSANNGMAAIVNPIGNIEGQVDFGKNGYVDFEKSRKFSPTVFSKYGNKIFLLIILLYIFLIFSFNRIKNE